MTTRKKHGDPFMGLIKGIAARDGTKSNAACVKCGAFDVYVTHDDDGDFSVKCWSCGKYYRVDGADS